MDVLASLSDVKAWVSPSQGIGVGSTASNANDDALLTRLIQQASQFILNYTNRNTFFKLNFTEVRNGDGSRGITLANGPVTSVVSVIVDNQTIPKADLPPLAQRGWSLEPWTGSPPGGLQQLVLSSGYSFNKGLRNVLVNYNYGFYTTDEAGTIPTAADYKITAQQSKGPFGRDDGVKFSSNGAALTPVASNPSTGQYSVDTAGNYTFAAADAGKGVLISYSYVPSDINQACIEIVGERYRYMQRIGQQSHSAAGQVTVSFSLKTMQEYVREILDNYRFVAIVW